MVDWRHIEVLGYAYYVERGYRVLVPVVTTSGYDFVAEKDGVFLRVNVKVAGLKDKTVANSWCISQASGSKPCSSNRELNDVDVFLAWMPNQNRFIELSGGFFSGARSKSKRIAAQHFMS